MDSKLTTITVRMLKDVEVCGEVFKKNEILNALKNKETGVVICRGVALRHEEYALVE